MASGHDRVLRPRGQLVKLLADLPWGVAIKFDVNIIDADERLILPGIFLLLDGLDPVGDEILGG